MPLESIVFRKPKPFVFKNAESILKLLCIAYCMDHDIQWDNDGLHCFRGLYLIGDNPLVDIKGAKQVSFFTLLVYP